jgi:hypothetical protein
MAGEKVKSVMLKILADDGDSEAKLDRISAKADELKRLHPDIAVRVDTAAASAKLAVLRRELKDTANEGKDSRITFKGLASDVAELATGLGAGSGAVGEMSMFQKVLLGLNVATGLGEPLIAGLVVAVGGLSAGLMSAGAGAGVFGLAAEGAFKRVEAADTAGKKLTGGLGRLQSGLKSVSGDWNRFITGSAGGVASVLVPALNLVPRALQLARGFLAPVEGALRNVVSYVSKGLNSGGFTSFVKMLQVNAGPMIEKLAHAIGNVVIGIGGIIKAFMPMAQRMGSGLQDITGKFAKWGSTLSGHSGFQSLMSMFKSETPLAMNALKSLGSIIKVVVSQMTGMSTFSNSKMLLQLADPVLKLAAALLKAHPQLVWLVLYLKLAMDGGKKLKGAFDGISGALGGLKTAKGALSDLKSGFGDAESAASDATGAWGSMGGKLSTVMQKLGLMKTVQAEATVATEGETAAQGELDVAMDANPIGLIIVAVAALGAGMYELIKHVTPVRNFFKDLWKDLRNWFMDGVHFVEAHWKQLAVILATVLLGPIAGVVVFVATHWDLIKSLTSKLVDDVRGILNWFGRLPGLFLGWFMDAARAVYDGTERILSFVQSLPGRIMHALSDLGSLLFSAGVNAIRGFISGMGSLLGDVRHMAESIGETAVHGVEHFLHIGSPSKVMHDRGMSTAEGFALGLRDGTHGVASAAMKMADAVAGVGAGARIPAGGAGGAPVQVQLSIDLTGGDSQLTNWLRNRIRIEGGDPRIITKKVKFA